jgi:tetratricopeptide (TPR) repeat protein
MQRKLELLAGILLLMSLGSSAPPAAAQNTAGVSGTVTDDKGKPLVDYVVLLKSKDMGTTYTLKTDKDGRFRQIGLRPGIYTLTLKPKDKDQVIVQDVGCAVNLDPDNHCDLDLKKLIATQSAEQEAARKKQEEEQKKFENMKQAFMAGQAKTEEADKARADMQKAPPDQRTAMQPKVNGLYQEALSDFQQAQQAAPEKDPNLPLVYQKLGYANEMMGNYDAAIAAYQKSIELKPASPDYENSLALAYAKAGKAAEATQACEKTASLDQTKGATCWLNLGVVFYNASRLSDAVEPLKKATAANPNSAQAWYLLGASLLVNMTMKTEGDKMIPVLAPGTVEAYQKCIDLDPNGPWGKQAKDGLAQLQAMGAGVETKIKVKGKKP